tara:strand:- start:504 stop:638 length:135 start_codon:yes stop_codon:yes gene_type:complete
MRVLNGRRLLLVSLWYGTAQQGKLVCMNLNGMDFEPVEVEAFFN